MINGTPNIAWHLPSFRFILLHVSNKRYLATRFTNLQLVCQACLRVLTSAHKWASNEVARNPSRLPSEFPAREASKSAGLVLRSDWLIRTKSMLPIVVLHLEPSAQAFRPKWRLDKLNHTTLEPLLTTLLHKRFGMRTWVSYPKTGFVIQLSCHQIRMIQKHKQIPSLPP